MSFANKYIYEELTRLVLDEGMTLRQSITAFKREADRNEDRDVFIELIGDSIALALEEMAKQIADEEIKLGGEVWLLTFEEFEEVKNKVEQLDCSGNLYKPYEIFNGEEMMMFDVNIIQSVFNECNKTVAPAYEVLRIL